MRLFPRPMTLLLAALIALAAALPHARAEPVVIKSLQNGKYAGFTGGYLAADRSRGAAHVFDLINLDGNKMALRDPATGTYLRAGVTGQTLLALGAPRIGGWETFARGWSGTGVTLTSVQNGKFLRAGLGPQSLFGAVSDRAAGWESFAFERVGDAGARPDQAGPVSFAGDWRVQEMYQGGQPVSLNDRMLRQTRFTITRAGGLSGSAGCNTLGAAISQSGTRITVSNVTSTKMLCRTPGYELEVMLAQVLPRAVQYAFSPRMLMLYDAQGRPLVRFAAR